jgi:hypothetical protein
MVESAKGWLKQNSTLVYFLLAQLVALAAGAASILSYSVKLETRVHILETRGAAYSVQRMDAMANEIAVLKEKIQNNEESISRVRDRYLNDRDRQSK